MVLIGWQVLSGNDWLAKIYRQGFVNKDSPARKGWQGLVGNDWLARITWKGMAGKDLQARIEGQKLTGKDCPHAGITILICRVF